MLETGDRPRADARTRLEAFRRDPRQGRTADLVAGRLPRLAGHAQHRALAGAGVTDDQRQILAPGDVVQGVALRARQGQASPFAGGQGHLPRRRRDAVLSPPRDLLGRPLQPLFDRQHFTRAEPLAAGAVLAERDQLGRGLHRAHGLGELIGVVGVPVNEARQVVVGEGALLPGDGVQRHGRLGDDLLAVAPGDLTMIDGPLGILAPVQAPRAGRADLVLRLQVDPLRLQRPVIDPRIDVEFGQARVHMLRPALAPVGQKVGAIPLADLLPERPLPVRFHLTHRQHDVGVRLGQAVRPDVPMHIEIGDHPAIDELLLHEVPRQLDALRLAHLSWYRELDLTGELGVLADLAGLDLVPQHLAVLPALGRTFRGHDLGVNDAGLVREVVRPP